MLIHGTSDVHIEWYKKQGLEYKIPERADVVVLAGDIGQATLGYQWIKKSFKDIPVIYVSGNHETYGKRVISEHNEKMKELCRGTNIHFLQNDSVIIDDVKFIGATLWTDYNLHGTQALSMYDAERGMNDYNQIYYRKYKDCRSPHEQNVTAYDLLREHKISVQYITEELFNYDGKKIVVTHHAPSEKSVHDKYRNSNLNPCYASNLEYMMMQDESPDLWFHGHVHDSFDYTIGKTRVIANPMGYPVGPKRSLENESYNCKLLVEI